MDDPSETVYTIRFTGAVSDTVRTLSINFEEYKHFFLQVWTHLEYPELCPCDECLSMREYIQALKEVK